jgi:hypothetical protein
VQRAEDNCSVLVGGLHLHADFIDARHRALHGPDVSLDGEDLGKQLPEEIVVAGTLHRPLPSQIGCVRTWCRRATPRLMRLPSSSQLGWSLVK